MRPQGLDEFYGQSHLLATNKPLRLSVETGRLHSMIFWGPPGTGKTTLARMIARCADVHMIEISAVMAGVKEVRAAVDQAKKIRQKENRGTLLFVDEVHRFNKSQQDAFLHSVEDGTLMFIGATTENPSFELNNALLSRARVYVLKSLQPEEIVQVLKRALYDRDRGLGDLPLDIEELQIERIAIAADGDARRSLNFLDIVADLAEKKGGRNVVSDALLDEVLSGGGTRRFDNKGEAFYDQISALHKSVRGSSPDAALYWFCRMLDGGCDPLYLARRVVRIASEDIGNADPRALQMALNAWDVQQRLGSPEGELAVAQALVYMASAAKSNAVYMAYKAAMSDAKKLGSLEVPMHIRNAPTSLMKNLDYGKGYRYAHDEPEAYAAGENYFPEEMGNPVYYQPVARGLEIKIGEKLKHLRRLDRNQKSQQS
ncbi:MAG TPA: replication-associated recombination protein A [Gammaproteobacteria bacterium]|nr:replication-associated recombination protein A [Gammaproteobacteria bacterium]